MLFGPVLKEIQAPRGIPTLDGEHSHKAGNIHIRQGTFTWGGEHSHRVGISKNLAGNNYIFCEFGVSHDDKTEVDGLGVSLLWYAETIAIAFCAFSFMQQAISSFFACLSTKCFFFASSSALFSSPFQWHVACTGGTHCPLDHPLGCYHCLLLLRPHLDAIIGKLCQVDSPDALTLATGLPWDDFKGSEHNAWAGLLLQTCPVLGSIRPGSSESLHP